MHTLCEQIFGETTQWIEEAVLYFLALDGVFPRGDICYLPLSMTLQGR